MSLAEQKHAIRLAALARRDGLDPAWRADMSARLVEAADALGAWRDAVVAGFWPIRSEVDVRPLMRALRERGARLALPAILDAETIVFRQWLGGDDLVEMALGTFGPREDAPVLDPAIILAPLAAFDGGGRRIGYGGGFYDRAIARMAARGLNPRIVGVAFACQEVGLVPAEPHDIPIREFLTEDGLRRADGVAA